MGISLEDVPKAKTQDLEQVLKKTMVRSAEEERQKEELDENKQTRAEKDKQKLEEYLKQALYEHKKVMGQSPLDQKFRKEARVSPLKERYDKAVGEKAVEAFKLKWACLKYKNIKESKSYMKSFQRVDVKKGEYVPLGKYIQSFGIHYDRDAAICHGLRGAVKMTKMGGAWCYIEPLSEALFVLNLRNEFKEELAEAWTMYKTLQSQATTDTKPKRRLRAKTSSCPSESHRLEDADKKQRTKEEQLKKNEEAKAEKKKAEALAAEKKKEEAAAKKRKAEEEAAERDRKRRGGGAGTAPSRAMRGRGEGRTTRAYDLKTRSTKAVNDGEAIKSLIEAGHEKWSFAVNLLGRLKRKIHAVHEIHTTMADFMMTPRTEFKKKHNNAHLQKKVSEMLDHEQDIAGLEKINLNLRGIRESHDDFDLAASGFFPNA